MSKACNDVKKKGTTTCIVDIPKQNESNHPISPSLNPFVATSFGVFVVLNVGFLLSIPPVLIGRGAPYLPTFKKNMDAMFNQLKKEPRYRNRILALQNHSNYARQQLASTNRNVSLQETDHVTIPISETTFSTSPLTELVCLNENTKKSQVQNYCTDDSLIHDFDDESNRNPNVPIVFVDLGSGDGRLVFRAANEEDGKLFDICIGYEINPFLHLIAVLQNIAFYYPRTIYNSLFRKNMDHYIHDSNDNNKRIRINYRTKFYLRNLWDVDLTSADVVAVYGLGPIMKDLGKKLETELKPGSYVLSNVFSFPGWIPISISDGTYIYRIPKRNK